MEASPERRAESRPVGRAVAIFAITGLVTLVVLALGVVQVTRTTGTDEAIDDAKRIATLAGRGMVQPEATDEILEGDPRAIARLDRVVRDRVLRDGVVRVKIWTRDGRVVYSDQHELIGSRYQLGAEDVEAFEHGGAEAEVSDLSQPENRFERRYDKLLEVYLPIETRSGRKLLFESYVEFGSVARTGRHLWRSFAPALLGGLVLLWLVQLPLAWRLARRVAKAQQDREALLQRALDASNQERRRIAHDLHDGVVQSLAGVSFALAAEAETAPPDCAVTLREAARETRHTVRELRSLLVDIYPPDLHRVGLAAALGDLVAPLRHRGVEADVQFPPDVELPREVEALFFRVTQEALRNALAHAQPTSVVVSGGRRDGRWTLTVQDDGRGFDPAAADPEGHFGLRMIQDATRDAGGVARIESSPGGGTRVHVEVPR
jgi:two-component system NarL family sensor kinase